MQANTTWQCSFLCATSSFVCLVCRTGDGADGSEATESGTYTTVVNGTSVNVTNGTSGADVAAEYFLNAWAISMGERCGHQHTALLVAYIYPAELQPSEYFRTAANSTLIPCVSWCRLLLVEPIIILVVFFAPICFSRGICSFFCSESIAHAIGVGVGLIARVARR